MQKNFTSYVKVIDDKLFQFICEPNAPVNHAKEFIFEVMKWIGDIEAYVLAQQQKEQAEKSDSETPEETTQEEA